MKPSILYSAIFSATLAIGVSAAETTNAPAAPAPEQHQAAPARRSLDATLAKIADGLNLTAEQRQQYDAASHETSSKMRELHQKRVSGALTPEEIRKQTLVYREELITKVKGILSAEQFASWSAAREAQGRANAVPGKDGAPRKRPTTNISAVI